MKWYLLPIPILLNFSLRAQEADTVLSLRIVDINAAKTISEHRRNLLDTMSMRAANTQDLGRLLQFNSPMQLREYGAAGLATATFRGQDARATDVFWHGLRLNSGFNGTYDFNQTPAFIFDNVSVASGLAASSTVSGGMGGAVVLTTDTATQLLSLRTGIEQYQSYYAGLRTSQQFKRWYWGASFFIRKGLNNFLFYNPISKQEERMDSAAFEQISGVLDAAVKIGKRHIFAIHTLFSAKNMDIPRHFAVPRSTENQREGALRWVMEDRILWKKAALKLRSGFVYANLRYRDSRTAIDDTSTETAISPQLDFYWNPNAKWKFYVNMYAYVARFEQDNFLAPVSDVQSSGSMGVTLRSNHRHLWEAILKMGTTNDIPALPIPILKHRFFATEKLYFSTSIGGTFMLPGANDKYWLPGGNPLLKPSVGRQIEFEIAANDLNKGNWKIDAAAQAYVAYTNYKIEWQPDSVGIWRANNTGETLNWGSEATAGAKYKAKQYLSYFQVGYYFNRSFLMADSLRLQRPLIPKHRINLTYGLRYKKFGVDLMSSYQSVRYQDRLKTQSMSAFWIIDAYLSYALKLDAISLTYKVYARNLSDTSYTLVYNRPLPGRVVGMSIELKL
jgi:iron complex outermembrane receptor protein